MTRIQPLRGNPESKPLAVTNDFSGGSNITYSDDLVIGREMRQTVNYDLDMRGELQARKGFTKNTALSELLFTGVTTLEHFPLFTKTASGVKEIILFKILENTNNSWHELSQYSSLAEFQLTHTSEHIKILVIAQMADNSVKYWTKKYVITDVNVTRTGTTGTLPCSFTGSKNNLLNVSHGEQFNKVFITSNDKGMVVFNNENDTFTYVGDFGVSYPNTAYKPHGMEIRRIGFNVLGDDPLTWIDNSTLVTESIQGVYLTTADRIPLSTIPAGTKFHVNIIYTGVSTTFTIDMAEYEVPLETIVTPNATYSSAGIAVYDVEFVTQPAQEVEIKITFENEEIVLEPYIDYYRVGGVDPKAKLVEQLNLGTFKIVQVFDRLVYYKGNTMWFTDVNQFDYVPNFNFILLPLDNTDEIVKIAYFRTSYIIFTKKRIYRLNGNFDSATLSVLLINDDLGCTAPNSVCLVENEMYFMSTRGLRSLKSDVFRENLENIREFDDKIYPLITNNPLAYGFTYKDQYTLVSNNRGVSRTVTVGNRAYLAPDVVRQYYKTNAFVFDMFTTNNYPRFIIFESGYMYSIMGYLDGATLSGFMYKFGDGYLDFDEPYDLVFETAGISLGYPLHEKKIKHIAFKFGGEAPLKRFYIEVYSDGQLTNDIVLEERVSTDPLEIESASTRVDKSRVPTKCKNVAVRVTTDSVFGLTLRSIGYVFKLGKVRE